MEWKELKAEFEPDGSLRDIYIHDATLSDWQAVIDVIRRKMSSLSFCTGGEPAEMPQDISRLFDLGPDDFTSSLYIPLGNGTLNCHFFTEKQIEFDLDPRDMKAELLPSLIDFMTLLGRTIGKPVSLTHENLPEFEILRFEPAVSRIEYVGPAFGS